MDKLEQYLPPGTKCFYSGGPGHKITCVVVSIEEAREYYIKKYRDFFPENKRWSQLEEKPVFGIFSNSSSRIEWMPLATLTVTEMPDMGGGILWD